MLWVLTLVTKPFFTSVHRYETQTRPYTMRLGLGLWLSLACLVMSLLIIAGVIMGLSTSHAERQGTAVSDEPVAAPIDFSKPAWSVTVPNLKRVRSLPTAPPKRHPLAPNLYKQSMDVGYAAYQQGDYQTALINFRRALDEKSGDRYATEAIANTEAIIQKQKDDSEPSASEARSPQ